MKRKILIIIASMLAITSYAQKVTYVQTTKEQATISILSGWYDVVKCFDSNMDKPESCKEGFIIAAEDFDAEILNIMASNYDGPVDGICESIKVYCNKVEYLDMDGTILCTQTQYDDKHYLLKWWWIDGKGYYAYIFPKVSKK